MARDSNASAGGGSPVSSMQVVDGGMYVPRRSLDRWPVLPATGVRHVVCIGDSVSQGTAVQPPPPTGGYFDGWVDRLGRALGTVLGVNVGAGFYGLWRSGNAVGAYNQTSDEWSFAGTAPTQPAFGGNNDVGPFGAVLGFAAGVGNTATWTRPTGSTPRVVADAVTNATTLLTSATAAFVAADIGSAIYGTGLGQGNYISNVVNATTITLAFAATTTQGGGLLNVIGRPAVQVAQIDILYWDLIGTGQWSYSINGGAFVAGPAATNDGTFKKFSVVTANPNTITIRAATAAGAGAIVQLLGVVVYNTVAPTAGCVVHNMCLDGGCLDFSGLGGSNHGFMTGALGDRLRILDNNGKATNTASLQPTLAIVFFSNDMSTLCGTGGSPAAYTANLANLMARLPYCDFLVVNCFEQLLADRTSAAQATFRAAVKAWCVTNGVAYLDIYDAWSAAGETGYAQANADRLMDAVTTIHPSALGHSDIAGHVMRAFSILAV